MKVIVCGGRDFRNQKLMDEVMDQFHATYNVRLVIEGGMVGADRAARLWAKSRGIHVATVDALWDFHRLVAGPIRNGIMLELVPCAVVAFPGGKGTRDMKRQAAKRGLRIFQVFPEDGGRFILRQLRLGIEYSEAVRDVI